MIIITGSSSKRLAALIAASLDLPLVIAKTTRFYNQELKVEIDSDLLGKRVVIIQSTPSPVNDNLMELLLLADSAKLAGAAYIIAVAPYLGYGRHDQASSSYTRATAAGLIARLIKEAGVDRLIALDLHSRQLEAAFSIEVENLDPTLLFAEQFAHTPNLAIVAPDRGALHRAQRLATLLKADLVAIDKTRSPAGDCQMEKISGEISGEITGKIEGRHCLIVDDIVDTGYTLIAAHQFLCRQGAISVSACITHAVFSEGCLERLNSATFASFYITDTIEQLNPMGEIKILPSSAIFANALHRA